MILSMEDSRLMFLKKKKSISAILKVVAFLLCLAIVYQSINAVVCHPAENFLWANSFRIEQVTHQKENSIDVLALGSSCALCSIIPSEFYSQYGYSAYNAGGEQCPVEASYLMLKELLKTQHPKVVFFEVFMLFLHQPDVWLRKTVDMINSLDIKREAVSIFDSEYYTDSKLSYLFPILKYHTRVNEISKYDFLNSVTEDHYQYLQGFVSINIQSNIDMPTLSDYNTGETVPFNEHSLEYFNKIVKLCSDNGIELILFRAPAELPAVWSQPYYNSVCELAQSLSIPYIDFNTESVSNACGYNYSVDQAEMSHPNIYGASKVSKYLADYIHENYDLPDRRGDKEYAYLEEELARYIREKHNTGIVFSNTLTSYLNCLEEAPEGYTVIFSGMDSFVNGLDDTLKQRLLEFGFVSDFSADASFQKSFIGIWQDGGVVYERISEGNNVEERDSLEYTGTLPDGNKFYVKSAGSQVGNVASIVINGVNYAKNSRGLNIVVYDNVGGHVVDSVAFDTHVDAGITYLR